MLTTAPRVTHPALRRLPKGWFHHGEQMLALLEAARPRVVVELGTCYGASAIAMARVLRPWGGVIYCVDTWCFRRAPGRAGYPVKLPICARNLQIAKVAARVRLLIGTTDEIGRKWDRPIDALYIDADHDYEAVRRDLEVWVPHVRSGGLIAGDDYGHPQCPGVKQAWDEFETARAVPLCRFYTPDTNPPGMALVYGVKP